MPLSFFLLKSTASVSLYLWILIRWKNCLNKITFNQIEILKEKYILSNSTNLKPGILFLIYSLIVALSGYQKSKNSLCILSWVPSADPPTALFHLDASVRETSCSVFMLMHGQDFLLKNKRQKTKTGTHFSKNCLCQCLKFNWVAGERLIFPTEESGGMTKGRATEYSTLKE